MKKVSYSLPAFKFGRKGVVPVTQHFNSGKCLFYGPLTAMCQPLK